MKITQSLILEKLGITDVSAWKEVERSWLGDKLVPRSRMRRGFHLQTYGPHSWMLAFNEGGKGLVFHILWRLPTWDFHFHVYLFGVVGNIGIVPEERISNVS